MTDRPTILHVAAVPFTARKLLLPQMQHSARAGYRVRLACAAEPGGWGADLAPFEPLSLAFPRQLKLGPLARALVSLPGVLRTVRPDILHLHSPAAALPARLIPRSALPKGMKVVYTVHGFAHQWEEAGPRDRVLARVEQALASRTDLMLFQSKEDFDESEARQFATRLRLLGNGVEDEWFGLRPPHPDSSATVLFVGRLVREKGVLELLEAVASVPHVRLMLAGAALDTDRDGVEGVVRARIAQGDLSGRVEQLGMLSRRELLQVMGRAGALVLPSYREGVPRSVIEALAAGRPSVVTDIRGCRELVRDGVNGFVVAPRSAGSLAQGLRQLTNLTTAEFTTMSHSARAGVDPERRESAVFQRLTDAYAEIGVAP